MSNLQTLIEKLHREIQPVNDGTVASYIPELAKVDPQRFGISIVTTHGQAFHVGDTTHKFTIQSISKIFTHGMALEDHGREVLLERVGVEPTGDPFNSIIRLDEGSKRPYNPMINAGAIATTSLLKGQGVTDKLNRMLAMLERYMGREVFIDMPTFMSERSTGHRN